MANSSDEYVAGARPSGRMLREYAALDSWTPALGIYLAFGIYPEDDGGDERRSYGPPEFDENQQNFLDAAEDAIISGDLRSTPTPAEFIIWANSAGLVFADDWLNATALVRVDGKILTAQAAKTARTQKLEAKLISEWALAPSWRHEEGAALSLKVPPMFVSTDHEVSQLPHEIRQHFERRLTFAERAYSKRQLLFTPTPREFLDWAASVGFPFSEAWEAAVPAEELEDEAQVDIEPSAEPTTRERSSLLKLVIGMAVVGYKYDPERDRNEAIKDIADDLDSLGIGMDVKTIRKWLREGAEILPREYLDDDR